MVMYLLFFINLIWAQSTDSNLIQKGKYLVTVGDCVSCHTTPNGPEFSGGLKINTPFGVLYSPNITPDPETGIGNWSREDFYKALHNGIGKNGEHLYPALPYVFYTKITKNDIEAMYAYFKSLPPTKNKIPKNNMSFPYNIRQALWGWKLLNFKPQTFETHPDQSIEWNRGAYLVEGLGHCGSCHTPRNFIGAIKDDRSYQGAQIAAWYAPDITSNRYVGLGDWTLEELISFLRYGHVTGKTSAVGPMAEVVENSLSKLTPEDIKAMAVYLKSIPSSNSSDRNYHDYEPGRKLYLQSCAGCHHPNGVGRMDSVPPLKNNPSLTNNNINIINVILSGVPPQNGFIEMPSFEDYSDQEVADLVNYILNIWGDPKFIPISPDDVQTRREILNAEK